MHFSLLLAALAVSSCAAHNNEPSSGRQDDDDEGVYRPLNVVRSKAADTLEARDTTIFENLNPGDSARMLFGKHAGEHRINRNKMCVCGGCVFLIAC